MVKRLLALALVGCGSFQDPQIVVDLRVLGMRAEPPEQVFPFDPQHPPTSLGQLGLVPAHVCGLVADPGISRSLDWTMTVCGPTDTERCDDASRPSYQIGSGQIEDPELADTPQYPCADIGVDGNLLAVLEDSIEHDPLGGFSGVDIEVDLQITARNTGEVIHAAKGVRYMAQVPADVTANHNPTILRLDGEGVPLIRNRCEAISAPLQVKAGGTLKLLPIETVGDRETYVLPTFDGGSRTFTESLSYQWLSTAGSWNRETSGGPRDASGISPPLDATWTAPTADELPLPAKVSLWVIQRDERLGASWIETCVQVVQ